jgi:hypothetical protein
VKRALGVTLIGFLLAAAAAEAQSPFDGTWIIDLDQSQPASKPDIYLLQNGTYHCTTCDPPVEVTADGKDHKIAGESCYDTINVRVIDDRTVEETDRRSGKAVASSRMTVSGDGKTATSDWSESCNAKGDVVAGKDILSRVAVGPPGSHVISGSWQISKRLNRSENAMVITLKLEGNIFSFSDPAGQGYAAKLDGTETAFKGGLSETMVSVKRTDENTIEETDKREGKIIQVVRFTLSADAKTMPVSMENKVNGTTVRFLLRKQ